MKTASQTALSRVLKRYKVITQEKQKQTVKKQNQQKPEQKPEQKPKQKKQFQVKQNTNRSQRQLDSMQKSFMDKYIEFTQLDMLIKNSQNVIKSVQDALGDLGGNLVKTIQDRKAQREKQIKDIVSELIEIKQNIRRQTEKVSVKQALIQLGDNLVVSTADKTQNLRPQKEYPVQSVDTDTDPEDSFWKPQMPQKTKNIVQCRKKKTKK